MLTKNERLDDYKLSLRFWSSVSFMDRSSWLYHLSHVHSFSFIHN